MTTIILPAGDRRRVITNLFETLSALPKDKGFEILIEEKGESRSAEQNRLQRLWHNEAASQLRDESAEDKRAYCKLHFGVPILRNDEKFKAQYDRVIKPLDYQTKLALMKEPFDFPVTRLMRVKQKTEFLDAIYQHYTGLGVRLSHPDDQGRAA